MLQMLEDLDFLDDFGWTSACCSVANDFDGHVALGLVIVRMQHVTTRAVAEIAKQLEAESNVIVPVTPVCSTLCVVSEVDAK